jgi:hypothetical protein
MTDPAAELDRAILDRLEGSGPMTVRALATALDASVVAVDRRCFALERAASIHHLGRGRYRVACSERAGGSDTAGPPDLDHGND